MFFLEIPTIITLCTSNIKKGYALRTSPNKSNLFPKRAFPGILHHKPAFVDKGKQGSVTIEASIAVPLFLFFVINLLSFFDILTVHIQLEAALHQTAREMAVYGYAVNKAEQKELLSSLTGSVVFSETYVRTQVNKLAGKKYLDSSCIKNGSLGINYSFSRIMENDRIELKAVYRVEPRVPYVGFTGFYMVTACKVRAFTGYDNTEKSKKDSEETIVYITKTGKVYHLQKNCTHLKLTISRVNYTDVAEFRNESGERYKPCEKCGKNPGNTVYITKEGNRYHSTISCSGLKRIIDAVPISQVGGRSPCSRCGG